MSKGKKIDERSELVRNHREAVRARHTEEGGAHNFLQRRTRVLELLKEDITEAFEKAHSVAIGLNQTFGFTEAVPEIKEKGYLDELVRWARRVIRRIDKISEDDVEFDLLISMTGPKLPDGGDPYIKPDVFKSKMDDTEGRFVIDLKDIVPDYNLVRLRGVGIAFSPNQGTVDNWRNRELHAKVKLPSYLGFDGKRLRRPPMMLGQVVDFHPDLAISIESGPQCFNVDPRGKWEIALSKEFIFNDQVDKPTEATKRTGENLKDVKLLLRLVAQSAEPLAAEDR